MSIRVVSTTEAAQMIKAPCNLDYNDMRSYFKLIKTVIKSNNRMFCPFEDFETFCKRNQIELEHNNG